MSNQEEKYEYVNHPKHYNNYDVEVIEMMERIYGKEAVMLWCEMTAFKYRMRAGTKPNVPWDVDIEKETWCLDKKKELKKEFNTIANSDYVTCVTTRDEDNYTTTVSQ